MLADVREQLQPYYSEIGYGYGLRSKRGLTPEVELHLAYR
jgi:hypothetical protein